MKKLKQIIIAGVLFAFGTFALAPVASVYAATSPTDDACAAIDCDDPNGLDISGVVKTIIQILSIVIGIAAVIMIMISGFKYITAGGDSAKITSAKNTIVYAIVGLIIVVLAQFIVQYVIGKTGQSVKPATSPTRKP